MKESLSVMTSDGEIQRERTKVSENEVAKLRQQVASSANGQETSRLRQQIADEEASHQAVLQRCNRNTEELERKIRDMEPSMNLRYNAEVRGMKDRMSDMEIVIGRQERQLESEGRIRKECEAQVEQANERIMK